MIAAVCALSSASALAVCAWAIDTRLSAVARVLRRGPGRRRK
ncbi:hypothetical protein ACWGRF_01920 [Streptomyces zhihengii]